MFQKKVRFPENQKRTIRSCGWIQSRSPCYRADNDDHEEYQCQCFEDGCNEASQIQIFSTVAILVLSAVCLFR